MASLLLILTVIVLSWLGQADRLAAWLFPWAPVAVAVPVLLGAMVLVAALLASPTRMLASVAILALVRGLLIAVWAVARGGAAACRTLWDVGRTAWRRLLGETT